MNRFREEVGEGDGEEWEVELMFGCLGLVYIFIEVDDLRSISIRSVLIRCLDVMMTYIWVIELGQYLRFKEYVVWTDMLRDTG